MHWKARIPHSVQRLMYAPRDRVATAGGIRAEFLRAPVERRSPKETGLRWADESLFRCTAPPHDPQYQDSRQPRPWRRRLSGSSRETSAFSQLHAPDGVIATFFQDQMRALAGGEDVLAQVDEVGRLPQRPRHLLGFVARQGG